MRWGIVGPGRIAETVMADFPLVEGAEVVAVASRSASRAEDFARRHGIGRAYGSYGQLLDDPEIDVLYIATTSAQHHAIAVAALRAGKSVLVEKPLALTLAGAEEILDAASKAGRFAMEGVWMRFHPAIARLRDLLAQAAIGDVRALHITAGLPLPTDPADRFYNAALGGGVLLDVGVYAVSLAQMILGAPDTVAATGVRSTTGVDEEVGLLLGWTGGRSASFTLSMRHGMPASARVFGSAGWIDVGPPFLRPERLQLHRRGAEPETFHDPIPGQGYVPELTEVTRCVLDGRTESTVVPWTDTLAVLSVLEEATAQLGVRHAEDLHALEA
ncbi:Gfo/Idh/MocA family protein [Petropleomorpha daqingensis]|uniref:Putative dehydrogenase n=1 Tax=Petropleomorpha daqingensis TaxID=2026353 RepID=A0A853CKX5_9ACTN|nr:putative dehydrogenase [Petropleomorpha daqingensis]